MRLWLKTYKVTVAGKMQGMDQLCVEYKRNGGDWVVAGYFTTVPANFTVTPQTPNQPESGHIRAVFYKKNLFADLDLSEFTRSKFDLDVASHYSRPNIFNLTIKKSHSH